MRTPSLFFCALLALAGAPRAQRAEASPRLEFDAAADYSAERAGLAVLGYVDGELVFERYQNGHTADRPQHIFSGTKSFAPMIALIAEGEGLLTLDEKVADTITEWRGDARRERVTIRHLLTFTSGLKNIDDELHSIGTRDKYAAAIACECVTEPGSRFRYGSSHLMVFGELMTRKLRARSTEEAPLPKDALAYLEARLLGPIGCDYSSWLRDGDGNPLLPYGAFLTAREWGEFGLLVLARGRHGDRQLVPAERFDQCFVGSEANPDYGLNFWLVGRRANRRDDAIPADAVAAKGMFGQNLYVVPSHRLVVVRLARTGNDKPLDDLHFLGLLFGG